MELEGDFLQVQRILDSKFSMEEFDSFCTTKFGRSDNGNWIDVSRIPKKWMNWRLFYVFEGSPRHFGSGWSFSTEEEAKRKFKDFKKWLKEKGNAGFDFFKNIDETLVSSENIIAIATQDSTTICPEAPVFDKKINLSSETNGCIILGSNVFHISRIERSSNMEEQLEKNKKGFNKC